MKFEEQKFIDYIKPYYDFCRMGDFNHVTRTAKWVKELARDKIDFDLFLATAYIHDIGWYKVAPNHTLTIEEIGELKSLADTQAPKLIKEVLEKFDFTKEEINKSIKLVESADRHSSNNEEEAIIVDSDNLSKLCKEHFIEKYEPSSHEKWIEKFEREFPDRIKTKRGLDIYKNLLSNLRKELIK